MGERPDIQGAKHGPRRGAARVALALLLVVQAGQPGFAASSDAAKPPDSGLKESVKVELVQLEVTVWPKNPESDACLGLTADDFELLVDNKPQAIYAVDALAPDRQVYIPDTAAAERSAGGGMSFVLFFDLWHLDLFYRFAACPRTKRLAFEEARRLVRDEFKPGDHLLLVTFDGWPVVHYGWITSQAEALEAVSRLERSRTVTAARQEHIHHDEWIRGIESLYLALGRYPGRKDVIYLGDDFRFDDIAMRMYEVTARAQANGVVVHSVDLLNSCRHVPETGGGLGGTPWSEPVALGPIAEETGGELFRTDRIAKAAHQLRSVQKCRYLVSFKQEPRKTKRVPQVRLRLKTERKDITLLAPTSFETTQSAPTKAEKDDALFLLPRFGRGIAAEVGVWPYRPAGTGGRWKAFVLAEIQRTDDEPWPEELTEIVVDVILHKNSKIYLQSRKTITGKELRTLKATGRQRLLFFPAEGVRPGEATVDLTVTGDAEKISANVRRSSAIPEPPGPGEARPWFLSDRVARLAGNEVPVPSLDGAVAAGEPVSFLAFGCRPKDGGPGSYSGKLIPFAGGQSVAVPITWLDQAGERTDACGWLFGVAEAPLHAGLWSFEPPSNLAGGRANAKVEFRIEGREGEGAPPDEITSK